MGDPVLQPDETLLSEDPQLNNSPLHRLANGYSVAIGKPALQSPEIVLRETNPEIRLHETSGSDDPRFAGQPLTHLANGASVTIGRPQLGQDARTASSQPAKTQTTDAERARRQRTFMSLQKKAVRGMGQPGEGLVPLSALPASLRGHMGPNDQGPVVGFAPSQLNPEERMLLGQLQMLGQREADAAKQEADAELAAQQHAQASR
jgi:hypothetical protein